MIGVVKFKDGKDGWELREIDRIDPMPDEVEIEVQAAGICGSELHLYHDNHVYDPPVVVGHEFCGVITRVGDEVKNYKLETGWSVRTIKELAVFVNSAAQGDQFSAETENQWVIR